jgi:hypothetical protein
MWENVSVLIPGSIVFALVFTNRSTRQQTDDTRARIRCPQCRWQPGPNDRWFCDCGHAWNTFQTRGRCPACQKQWAVTECLRCGGWSAHEDWYERDPERS